jgi:acetyl esterase/lipase
MKQTILLLSFFILLGIRFPLPGFAASPTPIKIIVYKTVGNVSLKLHVFLPQDWNSRDQRPGVIFFHGGGWKGGLPSALYYQSQYFAHRGLVAISVEYRLVGKNGKTPKDCVEDGKSALRWVRSHSSELGIDPEKIITGGGSAGGHVAAAATMCNGFNTPGEDASVTIDPKALVLFNPVLNNGPEGYGYELVKDYWKEISPSEHIRAGLPPMLVMFGDVDQIFTNGTITRFQEESIKAGNRVELKLYGGYNHGFFNMNMHKEAYRLTMADADKFLVSLGFLEGVSDENYLMQQCNEFDQPEK